MGFHIVLWNGDLLPRKVDDRKVEALAVPFHRDPGAPATVAGILVLDRALSLRFAPDLPEERKRRFKSPRWSAGPRR